MRTKSDFGTAVSSAAQRPFKRRRLSVENFDDDKDSISFTVPGLDHGPASRPILDDSARAGTIESAPAPNRSRTSFADLQVSPWLVAALAAMAIKQPTRIQRGCIPEILAGRDCIGGSRTGSGKTLAFAVPILQKWAQDPTGIYAVVLTPTRYVKALATHSYTQSNGRMKENWHYSYMSNLSPLEHRSR